MNKAFIFLLCVLIIAIVLGFAGKVSNGTYRFEILDVNDVVTTHKSYFGLLAEGFWRGHLDLPLEVPNSIKSLSDPLEPKSRKGISYLWDASVYQGKYYLYFGPVPALLFFIPTRIWGFYFSDSLVVLLCATMSVALLTCAILTVLSYKNTVSRGTLIYALLLSAFGSSIVLSLGNRVYAVSILSTVCFASLLVLLMTSLLHKKDARIRDGLLVGATVVALFGSRPSTFAFTLTFPLWCLVNCLANKRNFVTILKPLGAYIVTVLIGGISILTYNYLRFNDALEFGLSYQLTLTNFSERGYSVAFTSLFLPVLIIQAWHLILSPFQISSSFPFIIFGRRSFPFFDLPNGYLNMPDGSVGIIFSSLIILPGLITLVKHRKNYDCYQRGLFFSLALPSFFTMAVLLSMRMAAGRYVLDFCIPLFFIATVAWLSHATPHPAQRNLLRSAIYYSVIIFSVLIGVAALFKGYHSQWIR